MTKYDEIMNEINLSSEARERILNNVAESVSEEREVRHVNKNWKRYLTLAACLVLLIAGSYGISRTDIFKEFISDISGGDAAFEVAEESEEAASEPEAAVDDMEQSDELVTNNSKSAELPEESEPATPEEGDSAVSEEGNPETPAEAGDSGAPAEDSDELKESDSQINDEVSDSNDAGTAMLDGAVWDMKEYDSQKDMEADLGFSMGCEVLKKLNEEKGMTEVTYRIIDGNIGEIEFSDGSNSNYYRRSIGDADISGDYNEYKVMAEFDGVTTSGSFKGDKEGRYQLAVWTSSDGFTYAAYLSDGVDTSDWYEIIADCTGEVE